MSASRSSSRKRHQAWEDAQEYKLCTAKPDDYYKESEQFYAKQPDSFYKQEYYANKDFYAKQEFKPEEPAPEYYKPREEEYKPDEFGDYQAYFYHKPQEIRPASADGYIKELYKAHNVLEAHGISFKANSPRSRLLSEGLPTPNPTPPMGTSGTMSPTSPTTSKLALLAALCSERLSDGGDVETETPDAQDKLLRSQSMPEMHTHLQSPIFTNTDSLTREILEFCT